MSFQFSLLLIICFASLLGEIEHWFLRLKNIQARCEGEGEELKYFVKLISRAFGLVEFSKFLDMIVAVAQNISLLTKFNNSELHECAIFSAHRSLRHVAK